MSALLCPASGNNLNLNTEFDDDFNLPVNQDSQAPSETNMTNVNMMKSEEDTLDMAPKPKVPKILNPNQKFMQIEQESILGPRFLCPASFRGFEAYAISSQESYEFARFSKTQKCLWQKNSIAVYSSGFSYTKDLVSESLIGIAQQSRNQI